MEHGMECETDVNIVISQRCYLWWALVGSNVHKSHHGVYICLPTQSWCFAHPTVLTFIYIHNDARWKDDQHAVQSSGARLSLHKWSIVAREPGIQVGCMPWVWWVHETSSKSTGG